MQTLKFDINGMTCGGCTGGVHRALSAIDGVSRVAVSLQLGMATIDADTQRATSDQIEAAIANLGFSAKLRPSEAAQGTKS